MPIITYKYTLVLALLHIFVTVLSTATIHCKKSLYAINFVKLMQIKFVTVTGTK